MAASFVRIDRNTPMLLPPDLRDWVSEDDLVHFVIEACERLPLAAFRVNHRGSGSAQFSPHMMLALLVYSYSNGIFSSRKIERATYRDVAVRYLTADTHPDHDTICKFRRENLPAISAAFVDILELARSLGLLKLGKVATDGTHIKANASIDQNVTYQRAVTLRQRLQTDIDELMEQAEKADKNDVDDQSPVDKNELLPAYHSIPAVLGKPTGILADAGYVNTAAFSTLQDREKCEVHCSVHREDAHNERRYDFRPPAKSERKNRTVKDPALIAMQDKLASQEGKSVYKKRASTIETIFGIIKSAIGFRGFSLRGKEKVTGEWDLVCLSYNIKRLHSLKLGLAG